MTQPATDAEEPSSQKHPSSPNLRSRPIPGEPGLWVLLIGDMALFAVFFIMWGIATRRHPQELVDTVSGIQRICGLINTVALITSSWCVVTGLRSARGDHMASARHWYRAATALGGVFVAVKALEYSEKVHAGVDIVNNVFDMYYFTFTGIHLVHVLVGLLALTLAINRCRPGHHRHGRTALPLLEGVGVYWHMVDAFWIVLFLLIYLL